MKHFLLDLIRRPAWHDVVLSMPGAGLPERIRIIFGGSHPRVSRVRIVCVVSSCAALFVLFASGTLAERGRQATAQTAATTKPDKFDVVSIKPCPDVSVAQTGRGAGPNLAQTSPGHVYWACVTLATLVDLAYGGTDHPLLNVAEPPLVHQITLPDGSPFGNRSPEDQKRVRGGSSWMYSERFAIEATASVDVISPARGNLGKLPPSMNRALRAMLEDRFKLKVRRATEEIPMYALSVAPGGLEIKASAPDDCAVFAAGMPRMAPSLGKPYCGDIRETMPLAWLERLAAGDDRQAVMAMPGPDRRFEPAGVTLQAVVKRLSGIMDRVVLDKTGVTGEFSFAIEYTRNDNTPNASVGASLPKDGPLRASSTAPASLGPDQTIFQALAGVGLKLELTKGPAEYLQIESAERPRPNLPDALPTGVQR